MKKLLCAALVLVMSIMCALALIGCDPTDKPNTSDNSITSTPGTTSTTSATGTNNDAEIAKNAIKTVRGMYIDKAEETPADYTVIGQTRYNGQTYGLTWTVSPAEGCEYSDITPYVKVGEMDATTKLVTISVTKAEKEIKYVLTASITVGSATETCELNRKVPAIPAAHDGTIDNPYSAANVQEIAATLGDNEFLMEGDQPKQVYVEGYIVDCGVDKGNRAQFVYIVDEYSADKDSKSPDAVMVYSITYDAQTPVTKHSDLGLGDKIKVVGFIEKYVKNATTAPQPEVTYNGSTSVKAVTLEKATDSRTDAEKVAAALEGAEKDLKAKVYTAAGDVELPTSSVYGVEVNWTAAASDYVTVAANKMTIASIPETATTVELTVTAKIGTTEDSKKITITLQKAADLGTQHAGTEADPFSVADAIKVITPLDGNSKEYFTENGAPKLVYVKGYVTDAGAVNSGNTRLNNVKIADTENGTETLLVYSITFDKTFVTKDGDLAVGDLVTLTGFLQNYQGNTPELTYNGNVSVTVVAMEKALDTRTDAQKVTDALAKVEATLANITAAGEVTLPASTEDAVTFAWASDNAIAVVNGGKLTVATLPEADTVVTLTLTATCGTETQTKTVTVTVKAAVVVDPNALTATTTIEAYATATANAWAHQTQYKTINLNENITVTVTGGANTGKYYYGASYGHQWRIYQNESATLTFTATTGYTIATIKLTYASQNTGILASADGTTQYASDEVIAVNANTVTFSVGNTDAAGKNGQVRVSAIEVKYLAPAAPTPAPAQVKNASKGMLATAAGVATFSTRAALSATKTFADDTTITAGNSLQDVKIALDDNITVTFDKKSNSNVPKYYSTGTAVRLYGGGTMTVTAATGYQITGITLTFGSGDKTNTLTPDTGTFNDTTDTYTPDAGSTTTSVIFTVGSSSGHRRIAGITVEYSEITPVGEMTDEEKAQNALDIAVATVAEIPFVTGTTYTEDKIIEGLPTTTSVSVEGVTVSWTSTDAECVTVEDNVMYIMMPNATKTVTLTLTATCNSAVLTQTYTITLKVRTSTEKIEAALANVSVIDNITAAGDVLLPTSSEQEVSFTWTTNSTVATVVENKNLHVAELPNYDTIVTLTLTATCDNDTQTKEFSVTVKAFSVITTSSVDVVAYGTSENWDSGSPNKELIVDDVITATVGGNGANSGKFYSDGWRFYESDSGTLELSATTGYTIVSVKVTFTADDHGVLESADGSTQYASNDVIAVNANTVSFGINHSSGTKKGKVHISNIEVNYTNCQNLGTYNNETVYGTLRFLGCGIRTEAPTGARFGFALTLSTENQDTMRAVAATIKGLFTLDFKVDGTAKSIKGGVESYRIDGNKLIMDAIIISNFDLNNETHKNILNADITTTLSITVGENLSLETSGTRKIVEIAKAALEANEIGADVAAKYGYTAA